MALPPVVHFRTEWPGAGPHGPATLNCAIGLRFAHFTPPGELKDMSRFLFVFAIVLGFAFAVRAQEPSHAFDSARSIVDRVQADLGNASAVRPKGDQRERVDHAQNHLSQFDKGLSHGKFDKDKLSDAIGDIKGILDHNTLTPEGRDMLTRDLSDLKVMRERRGIM
jgi:hypothetical protein